MNGVLGSTRSGSYSSSVDPRLLMPLAHAEPNKGEWTDTSEQRTSGQANGGAGDV